MIIYLNIDGRNLFALAAILNFAVRWCEIWNQEIFWAARISYNMSLHITPFADHLGEKDIHFREV